MGANQINKAYRDEGREIVLSIHIEVPACINRAGIWFLLLYRRVRHGYRFRKIALTQGQWAIVDPWRYDELNKYQWYAHKGKGTYYAYRAARTDEKRASRNVKMHHEVIKLQGNFNNFELGEAGERLIIDHINGDGRDNREGNLRLASYSQNSQNRRKVRRRCGSQYKGVWYSEKVKKWRAQICFGGTKKHLGYYEGEAEAARAYDRAAVRYHGSFARLNFESK